MNYKLRAIVTNKHIQKRDVKVESGFLYFNKRDESGNCLYGDKLMVNFTDDEWIHHPTGEVDLSILTIGTKLKKLERQRVFLSNDLCEIVLSVEYERSRVGPLEDIVSIGYPNILSIESIN